MDLLLQVKQAAAQCIWAAAVQFAHDASVPSSHVAVRHRIHSCQMPFQPAHISLSSLDVLLQHCSGLMRIIEF
jgi:hypothetical protein